MAVVKVVIVGWDLEFKHIYVHSDLGNEVDGIHHTLLELSALVAPASVTAGGLVAVLHRLYILHRDIFAVNTGEAIKTGDVANLPSLLDMLLGNRGGAIGETCAIALILGGIYLIVRKVISWHTPVIFIATVFVLSLIVKQDLSLALYEVLGGGLLIGAIFMATDYSTTPINKYGKMVFAFGCGLVTCLIRFWGSYPEGVSFAILLMNILAPYIEKWCTPKPFGKAGKN